MSPALIYAISDQPPAGLADSVDIALRYNRLDEAQRLLAGAQTADPESAELLLALGEVLFRQNNLIPAKDVFQRALKSAIAFGDSSLVRQSNTWLGITYYDLKEYDRAAEYFAVGDTSGNNLAFSEFLRRFAGKTPWRIAATGKSSTVRILDTDPFPKIGVTVNGHYSDDFIFDTGCNFVTLSSGMAKKCGIVHAVHLDPENTGGTPLDLGLVDSLRIGDFIIHDIPVIILDSKQMSWRLLGITLYKISGAVGLQLLREFVTTVDYSKKEITFTLPPAVLDSSRHPNLTVLHNILYSTVSINESRCFNFMVDSGTPYSAITENALQFMDPAESTFAKSRRGERKHVGRRIQVTRDFLPRGFGLGDYAVDDMRLEVLPEWKNPGGANIITQGILAADFLRQFVVVYDFPHMQLRLAPASSD